MTDDWEARVKALEERVGREPDSEFAHFGLLREYLVPQPGYEGRRIDHIVEFLRRFPRSTYARTPCAEPLPEDPPEACARIGQAWLEQQRAAPNDAEIASGFGLFLARREPERAAAVFRAAAAANPSDAELYTNWGRSAQDPAERLTLFLRARELGGTQPNLLTWIGRSAIAAGELEAAANVGRELLGLAREARILHGERVEWRERGRELWERVRATCGTDGAAREVTHAIADCSNRTHWAHTFLGVVAVRQGDDAAAVEHLRQSVAIGSDYRLSSYGPSFSLARELAQRGAWEPVADYLRECRRFWDRPILAELLAAIERHELPEFFEDDA